MDSTKKCKKCKEKNDSAFEKNKIAVVKTQNHNNEQLFTHVESNFCEKNINYLEQLSIKSPLCCYHRNNQKLLKSPNIGKAKVIKFIEWRKNTFSTLPNEIILYIFSLLPISIIVTCCIPVCKKWKCICYDKSLWKKINLETKIKSLATVIRLINYGVKNMYLMNAMITKQEESVPIFFETISQKKSSKHLKYLDLSYATVAQDDLKALLSVCAHLEVLYVSGLNVNEDIEKSISFNKELRELYMDLTRGNTEIGILKICKTCTELKILDLEYANLSSQILSTLSDNIPNCLMALFISENSKLQDPHMQQIIRRCPNLKELAIAYCINLTSAIVDFIFYGLKKIERLEMIGIPVMIEKLHQLQSIPSLAAYSITDFNGVLYCMESKS